MFIVAALACVGAAAQNLGRESFNDGWTFNLEGGKEQSVTLPHDWAIKGDFNEKNPSGTGGGALPGGIGWYRKTFVVDKADRNKHFRIDFDGVYMNASVWVNGYLLGTRPYGYISFGYDITPYLRVGENVIAVKVDNKEQPNSRWYSGCGIYRNVWLTKTNGAHILNNGVHVTMEIDSISPASKGGQQTARKAIITVTTTLVNSGVGPVTAYIQNTLRNLEGSYSAKSNRNLVYMHPFDTIDYQQKIEVDNPRLWNVNDPYLYVLETEMRYSARSKTPFYSSSLGGGFISESDKRAIAETDNGLVNFYNRSYKKHPACDVVVTPVGLRTAEFTDKGFKLNGAPMQIQGVCLHHDLGCLGAAVNPRAIKRQLQLLKDMGINGIRCSHNPPSPELLDLCDAMGFLVMDESFDMWRKKKTEHDYARYFSKWHEQDLNDFVVRDRNHPSVIMWSIGNEVLEQWTDVGADKLTLEEANLILNFGHSADQLAKDGDSVSVNSLLTRKLAGMVRALDSTRPVTAGCNEPNKNNHLFKSGALDIIGFNYHNQDVKNVPSNFPGKPFIITESVSALQTRGYYRMPSDSMFVWPERWDKPFHDASYSCSSYDNCHAPWSNTHEENLLLLKKNPWICGQYVWTGFDYIGEPTPYGWPARSSYFGIIDLAGFPKDVYYLYQSELTNKDVLHLFPHWTWNTPESRKALVDGCIDMWAYYNNADEVELYVNGTSQGVRRKTDDQLHVVWRVKYEAGEVKVVSRKDGKEVKSEVIRTAGAPASIRLTADKRTVTSDGRDLSFVTVEIVDAEGNICPWADNLVKFSVEGSGFIAGVDNGSPISLERFADNKRKAFYGKCLVVLQNNGGKETIRLSATSEGLQSNSININVTQF